MNYIRFARIFLLLAIITDCISAVSLVASGHPFIALVPIVAGVMCGVMLMFAFPRR